MVTHTSTHAVRLERNGRWFKQSVVARVTARTITAGMFLYDVWVELWGQPFADEQVTIESRRKGIVDYEGIWKKTLALSAAERARRFQGIIRAK